MNYIKKPLIITLLLISTFAFAQTTKPIQVYDYSGRVEHLGHNNVVLIGSASSVAFNFTGEECDVVLQSVDSYEHNNYVSLELDGKYLGRLTIEKGEARSYPVNVPKGKKTHQLKIFKATEAANGKVIFKSTTASLVEIQHKTKKKIEFIGNSITCGMGNETREIPCGTGEWFDQHNAYLAYGPRIARDLDVDFQLSSVSGIGMYRNWNDENKDEAIMPDVYGNLYLNKDTSKPYDFGYKPDVISIALGTNDFSDGDGKKERLPFNPEKFINNYINFIRMLYKHNDEVQIIIVNSPMVKGEKDKIFKDCLDKIKDAFKNEKKHKPIQIFQFDSVEPHGCGYHPDADDHKLMADQYLPFLKKILK